MDAASWAALESHLPASVFGVLLRAYVASNKPCCLIGSHSVQAPRWSEPSMFREDQQRSTLERQPGTGCMQVTIS